MLALYRPDELDLHQGPCGHHSRLSRGALIFLPTTRTSGERSTGRPFTHQVDAVGGGAVSTAVRWPLSWMRYQLSAHHNVVNI